MTGKNTTKFILASLILLSFTTYGQTKNKKQEKDTTKYWEVGTDLLWLINKNQLPPINIQIKKHLKENSALRFRVGLKYNTNDSSYNSLGWPGPPYESRNFTGFIRAGWETESKLKGKLSFYKGIDLGFWYERDILNWTRYWVEVDTYIRYNDSRNTFTYEILPFLGFKYYFSDAISISLESSIRFFYQHDKYIHDGNELPGYPSVAVGAYENKNTKNGIAIIHFNSSILI